MESLNYIETPLISVIIPVYMVEKELRRCLNSVIIQTYNNLEIILVDDASQDCSGKICSIYAQRDSRIQVIYFEHNRGVSCARNMGIYKAKGEFICFIDADDYIEPNMIERLYISLVEQQCDISICGTDRVGFEKDEYLLENDFRGVFSGRQAAVYMIKGKPFNGGISGRLFNCSLVKKYPFIEDIYCGEDLLFNYRICQHVHRVSYIPDRLYHYINRKESATHEDFSFKQYTELYVYDFLIKDMKKNSPQLIQQMEKNILEKNISLAVKVAESKKIKWQIQYRYIRRFHKNIRHYFNERVLTLFSKKIASEVILLYISPKIFLLIAVLYKRVKNLIVTLMSMICYMKFK